MWPNTKRNHTFRLIAIAVVLALTAAVVWIDVSTDFWQEFVVISGVAAGFISFLLTVLVIDRILTKAQERRWAPVARLALTDFMHVLAEDRLSDISRGLIIARSLSRPSATGNESQLFEELHELRTEVVDARRSLSTVLSNWLEFLSSHGDYQSILDHVASIALNLDTIRDLTLEREISPSDLEFAKSLSNEIIECNESYMALVDEMKIRIAGTTDKVKKVYRPSDELTV